MSRPGVLEKFCFAFAYFKPFLVGLTVARVERRLP